MIRLADLRVAFGRTVALGGLSTEIHDGVTGVFGPNASGKSTLLRVVAGLLRPTSGEVTIGSTRLPTSDEGLRRRIGYAGHQSGLYGHLTVEENLALFARLYGVSGDRARAVLSALDVVDRSGIPVRDLSAGLRRRVAIARALLHEPELLLLDEPYANLDDDAADLVTDAVRQWRRPGRTALIATHGAKRLKPYADARLVLRRGRIASHARVELQETVRP